ncbi:hypothetical protein Bache_1525 [Bacteroides helcogenes P 36-108]|uniref:Uncharacterized protein n=1 Tax=Bacteroides helcogenes (strain ATCC 35417 / DSM 20613 / JCM 6297 / CCUG 15421 / P 36-108) TaxID=693979 RepID=E6SVR9_BACT6|nr:hypothetical protein Bache_1525 [Bacteroides helcogenes P 36-108]
MVNFVTLRGKSRYLPEKLCFLLVENAFVEQRYIILFIAFAVKSY